MATQTIAFRAGHQSASDLNVVRQDFNTHDNSGRLPRRNKLRTNNSPNESIDNCVHDPKDHGRSRRHEDSFGFHPSGQAQRFDTSVLDGAEHLEKRIALESAVAELELLEEQLDKENLALRHEVDRVSMLKRLWELPRRCRLWLSRAIKVAATDSTVLITAKQEQAKS